MTWSVGCARDGVGDPVAAQNPVVAGVVRPPPREAAEFHFGFHLAHFNKNAAPGFHSPVDEPEARDRDGRTVLQRIERTGIWFVHRPVKGRCYPRRCIFFENALAPPDWPILYQIRYHDLSPSIKDAPLWVSVHQIMQTGAS